MSTVRVVIEVPADRAELLRDWMGGRLEVGGFFGQVFPVRIVGLLSREAGS